MPPLSTFNIRTSLPRVLHQLHNPCKLNLTHFYKSLSRHLVSPTPHISWKHWLNTFTFSQWAELNMKSEIIKTVDNIQWMLKILYHWWHQFDVCLEIVREIYIHPRTSVWWVSWVDLNIGPNLWISPKCRPKHAHQTVWVRSVPVYGFPTSFAPAGIGHLKSHVCVMGHRIKCLFWLMGSLEKGATNKCKKGSMNVKKQADRLFRVSAGFSRVWVCGCHWLLKMRT